MSSSENQKHHDNSSQCPQCKKKYISSSQEQEQVSEQNEKIIIPIRKDMISNSQDKIQSVLRNLKVQVQNLKQSNVQKDKMIDDLKKQLDHKITHYMIYGEINKQTDEINRLKTQISYGTTRNSRRNEFNEDQIRQIAREQSKRQAQKLKILNTTRERNQYSKRKTFSTRDNYSQLKKQLLNQDKQKNNSKNKQTQQQSALKQYFFNESQGKPQVLGFSQAKKKIAQLQQRIKIYEKQMIWMSNFVSTFIKTMQNIAYKKYQQQIIIPQWSLKKKAKTSWRYMKHVFNFLYSDNQA